MIILYEQSAFLDLGFPQKFFPNKNNPYGHDFIIYVNNN